MDIRLEQMPFEVDGKTYQLRCNMNVLADVQELHDGDFVASLKGGSTMKSALEFLAAMLNDYADEQGWEERYTARKLGRKFKLADLPIDKIMSLVIRSITPDMPEETEAELGN
jgi:hypothetical protein